MGGLLSVWLNNLDLQNIWGFISLAVSTIGGLQHKKIQGKLND